MASIICFFVVKDKKINDESIKIRFATVSDAAAMSEIASSNLVPIQDLSEYVDKGFTIWPRDEAAYRMAIEHSDNVLIAEEDGAVVGHFLAYSLPVFRLLDEFMACEDKINRYLQEHYSDDVIFMDQVTILRSHHRKGIGRKFDEFMVKNSPHNNLWVTDIVHEPVRNQASIDFFVSRGFYQVCEKKQDDWVLGIYERETDIQSEL